jgi:predicted DNA-binding transcriptional regulator YafY
MRKIGMYHPTSRVLTVLELLQTHQRISGPQLAARLEVDVRTVRRYIAMLQDIGIPIEAETGRHGCYVLRPGFKLPPLLFTNDEAVAVALGLLLTEKLGLHAAAPAVEGALAKLERVLPTPVRREVQALQTALVFDMAATEDIVQSSIIAALSVAVQEQREAWLRYAAGDEITERAVDPYGVVSHGGRWYVVGYCHLRGGMRTFRLDRISSVTLREQCFTRPPDFDPLAYLVRSIAGIPDRWNILVTLHTTLEQVRHHVPASLALLEECAGGVMLQSSIDDLAMLARVLISIGCPFAVHEPPELRATLRQIAADVMRMADEAHGVPLPHRGLSSA